MRASILSMVVLAGVGSPEMSTGAVPLLVEVVGSEIVLRFDVPLGVGVGVEQSADLLSWGSVGEVVYGGESAEEFRVAKEATGQVFFRLVEVQLGVAPTPAEFVEQIVGTTFAGYDFTTATDFDWFGEAGRWSYTRTGPDEGLLVFTYDADGNDPAVYREEIVLSFATPTTGTFRYSEYYSGVEAPLSVETGPFAL